MGHLGSSANLKRLEQKLRKEETVTDAGQTLRLSRNEDGDKVHSTTGARPPSEGTRLSSQIWTGGHNSTHMTEVFADGRCAIRRRQRRRGVIQHRAEWRPRLARAPRPPETDKFMNISFMNTARVEAESHSSDV